MMKFVTRTISSSLNKIRNFLTKPHLVLLLCAGLLFFKLILQGQLYTVWSLYQDKRQINHRMARMQEEANKLQMLIERVEDPRVLELEARDRLDLVQKGDLVFVFTDATVGSGKNGDGYKANPWSD
jgi:cell division protein FtsB